MRESSARERLLAGDRLGLAPFRPDPRFGMASEPFFAAPSRGSHHRLREFCAFDLDRARERMGPRWEAFAAYAVELAGDPGVQAALGSFIGQFGATPTPPEDLARITAPTALVRGRHDLAPPLSVAEDASARHGRPLHVVDDAGDDPPLDRPDAFLAALRRVTEAAAEPVAVR